MSDNIENSDDIIKKHINCNGNRGKLCKYSDCDYCFNRSFALHEKAQYWSNKNELDSRQVFLNSNSKYWFNCNVCSHIFNSAPGKINNNTWCPFCINKLCDDDKCKTCFEKSFASHIKSELWSNKNEIKPRDIPKSSEKKFIFNCAVCKHEFVSSIYNITHTTYCPYCSNKLLCDNNNCNMCFEKSCSSHNKIKYWSNKNKEKPRQIFKNSHKKFIFNCQTCTHEYETRLRCLDLVKGCLYCSHKSVCGSKDCILCFENSFVNHPKAIYWSDKNEKTPIQVYKESAEEYIFNCNVCHHEFTRRLTELKHNCWCPFCSHHQICSSISCEFCYENSFASHPKAIYWSSNNKNKPRDVFKSSNNKYLFNCDNCKKEFSMSLDHVCGNRWCSYCKFRTEKKLLKWLETTFCDYIIKRQEIFDWCIYIESNKNAKFDFCIPELKILIELDGPQHFKQVANWSSHELTKIKDIFKIKCAVNNGYSIIHILQEDVNADKNDWNIKLKNCIDNIISLNNIIFIDNKSHYCNHIGKLDNLLYTLIN